MNLKKQLKVISMIFIIGMLLSACATPQERYAKDYTKAQTAFAAQDYGIALHKLQVPARAGIADAQYALGYMYYYGKGTVINEGAARYWFKQAAVQGQPEAKKALGMIRRHQRLPGA